MSESKAIEDHIYDFLAESIAAAEEAAEEPPAEGEPWVFDPDNPLAGAQLNDTVFRDITSEYGIFIWDGSSKLVPNPGATEMLEADGTVTISIFSLVTGPDRSDRAGARTRMITLSKAVAKLFMDDPTMNERVNDSRIDDWPRGWDSIKSKPYSVANAQVLVNEYGGPIE